MADLEEFVGTWHAERGAPFSTHTFTWVASDAGLRGEWIIEAGAPAGGHQARPSFTKLRRHQMQVGEPSFEEGRALFTVNGGPYVSEFRLVGGGEALVGAAVDKLPPKFAGPDHQRSIEGHRIRLRKHSQPGQPGTPGIALTVNPVIRSETPADIAAIHAVTTAAFLHAPHADHTEQFIVDALRKAGALSISLVADDGGVVVGHVAVSPVSVSDDSIGWFGLGPISVNPKLQRRGVGSLLMQGALRLLRERGAAGCVVLGDPAYYARFGFKPEAGLVLPDVPSKYFQALSFGPSLPRGVVKYHVAFSGAIDSPKRTALT